MIPPFPRVQQNFARSKDSLWCKIQNLPSSGYKDYTLISGDPMLQPRFSDALFGVRVLVTAPVLPGKYYNSPSDWARTT